MWARFPLLALVALYLVVACCSMEPPLLDKEWSSAYVETGTDHFFSNGSLAYTFTLSGWTHQSLYEYALRTDGAYLDGGYQVFIDYTANVSMIIVPPQRCCSVYNGTEGNAGFQGPDVLRRLGFQYNGTISVPVFGEVDVFDLSLMGPFGYPYDFQVYLKAGTNQRVAYIVDAIEGDPLTHHHDEVWYVDYIKRGSDSWPSEFFYGQCPQGYTVYNDSSSCDPRPKGNGRSKPENMESATQGYLSGNEKPYAAMRQRLGF